MVTKGGLPPGEMAGRFLAARQAIFDAPTVASVRRILLTGMSGTGKSTVVAELAARGYRSIDCDADEWSEWAPVGDASGVRGDLDWVWRADLVEELLSAEDTDVLFLGGCAPNQVQFQSRFDAIVLLSAPAALMAERLATRSTNLYGRDPAEAARVLQLKQTVEPRLRRVADLEIDTSAPLDQVVAEVLRLAR